MTDLVPPLLSQLTALAAVVSRVLQFPVRVELVAGPATRSRACAWIFTSPRTGRHVIGDQPDAPISHRARVLAHFEGFCENQPGFPGWACIAAVQAAETAHLRELVATLWYGSPAREAADMIARVEAALQLTPKS